MKQTARQLGSAIKAVDAMVGRLPCSDGEYEDAMRKLDIAIAGLSEPRKVEEAKRVKRQLASSKTQAAIEAVFGFLQSMMWL